MDSRVPLALAIVAIVAVGAWVATRGGDDSPRNRERERPAQVVADDAGAEAEEPARAAVPTGELDPDLQVLAERLAPEVANLESAPDEEPESAESSAIGSAWIGSEVEDEPAAAQAEPEEANPLLAPRVTEGRRMRQLEVTELLIHRIGPAIEAARAEGDEEQIASLEESRRRLEIRRESIERQLEQLRELEPASD